MQKERTEGLLMIAPRMGRGQRNPSKSQIKEYHKSIQQSLMGSISRPMQGLDGSQ